MEEATGDKQGSKSESKEDRQKTQGWIRIHTDEKTKSSTVDEPLEKESQPGERKIRIELTSETSE